jgi:hypothetical protein
MKRKVTILMALGILYLAADIAINGLTTVDEPYFKDGKVPTGMAGSPYDKPTSYALEVLFYGGIIMYILGVFGPTPREEHVDGIPVDAAMHESIFGMNYEE